MGLKNAISLKGWAPRDGFFWDSLILKTGKIKYLKQPDMQRLNSFPFVLKHNFLNMPWACCESNLSPCFLSGECLLSVLISHKHCDWYGPKASGKLKFYNETFFLKWDRIVCGRRVYRVPMMGKGYYRDIHQQYVLYILSPLVSTAVLVHSNVRQLIRDLNTTGLISLHTDLQK